MRKTVYIQLFILLGLLCQIASAEEATNLDEAKQLSQQLNLPILLEFVRED